MGGGGRSRGYRDNAVDAGVVLEDLPADRNFEFLMQVMHEQIFSLPDIGRRSPGWFLAAKETLKPILRERDAAAGDLIARGLRSTLARFRLARTHAKRAIITAKDK